MASDSDYPGGAPEGSAVPGDGRRPRWLVVLAGLLAAIGAAISLALTFRHLRLAPAAVRFLEAGCGRGAGWDCDAVLRSPWGSIGGVPVALVGAAYFAFFLAWCLIVGRPNSKGRFWMLPPLLIAGLGLVQSVNLTVVMYTRLPARCPWCLAVHAVNAALFATLVALWPARAAPVPAKAWPGLFRGTAATLACLVLAAAVIHYVGLLYRASTLSAQRARLWSELQAYRDDADLQLYLFDREQPVEIALPDGAHTLGDAHATHTLVMFGDLQCPACRQALAFLREFVLPMFKDRLRLVFVHFPLNSACNPGWDSAEHALACRYAAIAEAAARLSPSPDAFWRAYEHIVRSAPGAPVDLASLAAELDLDPAALADEAADPALLDRIRDQARAGADLGLHQTPTLFLDGRRIREWRNQRLWEALAKRLTAEPPPRPAEDG